MQLEWLIFIRLMQLHTLVYRIDVQYEINVQVGKFLENIKRADQNKAVQGGIFSQN